jgi:hypothetical protein
MPTIGHAADVEAPSRRPTTPALLTHRSGEQTTRCRLAAAVVKVLVVFACAGLVVIGCVAQVSVQSLPLWRCTWALLVLPVICALRD